MTIFSSTPALHEDEWPYTRPDGSGRFRYPGRIGEEWLISDPRPIGPTGKPRAHEGNYTLVAFREVSDRYPVYRLLLAREMLDDLIADGIADGKTGPRSSHAQAVLTRYLSVFGDQS